MCQETVWACYDCGAERSIAWDHCFHYWYNYTQTMHEPSKGVKPDPNFCPLRERSFRPFRLGACPNLERCPSKQLHEVQRTMERLQAEAVEARRQEWEEKDRQEKEDFARRYFVKRPIPPAPTSPGGITLAIKKQETEDFARRYFVKKPIPPAPAAPGGITLAMAKQGTSTITHHEEGLSESTTSSPSPVDESRTSSSPTTISTSSSSFGTEDLEPILSLSSTGTGPHVTSCSSTGEGSITSSSAPPSLHQAPEKPRRLFY